MQCTTPEVFDLWKISARQTGNVKTFCIDCTPAFKAKMCVAGKCSNPTIKFREDEDGFVEGFDPKVVPEKVPSPKQKEHIAKLMEKREEDRLAKQDKVVLALRKGPATAPILSSITGIPTSTLYAYLYRLMEAGRVAERKIKGKITTYCVGAVA